MKNLTVGYLNILTAQAARRYPVNEAVLTGFRVGLAVGSKGSRTLLDHLDEVTFAILGEGSTLDEVHAAEYDLVAEFEQIVK